MLLVLELVVLLLLSLAGLMFRLLVTLGFDIVICDGVVCGIVSIRGTCDCYCSGRWYCPCTCY